MDWMRREELPFGPWSDEPNEYDWRHEGVECRLRRGPQFSWCGYVNVLEGHHWAVASDALDRAAVHGGVTFRGWRIFPPLPKLWWIGFDCNHHNDLAPGEIVLGTRYTSPRLTLGVYRDFSFAKREAERLAEQVVIFDRFRNCNFALIDEVTKSYFETGADESDLSLLEFATEILTGARACLGAPR